MFEEGQLYSPVTRSDAGDVTVHLARRPPRRERPRLPRAPQRDRRRRTGLAARRAGAAGRLHGGRAGGLADRLPGAARRSTSGSRSASSTRRVAAVGAPDRSRPRLDEVSTRLEPITGFRYVPAAGLVPLREFYGSLEERVFHSTQYIRHPARAALHPGAGHHPRGHRPRAPARHADLLRAAPPRRRRRPTGSRATRASLPEQGVLVLARVRRRRRGRRAARLRRRDPVALRRDRRVPRHGASPAGPHRDGDRRLRHHPLPARPVPAESIAEVVEVVGGFFETCTDESIEEMRREHVYSPEPQPQRTGARRPMPLHGIDHVELWVGNAAQAAYFLTHAFGFTEVAYAGLETGAARPRLARARAGPRAARAHRRARTRTIRSPSTTAATATA